MLDVSLRNVVFRDANVSLEFARGAHTAVIGMAGSGISTLLRLIAGEIQPESGDVVIGSRRVNGLATAKRPLLYVTADPGMPPRWSVQHALVAAVRTRSLDRTDRHREYELAVEKWALAPILERRLKNLGATEAARVHLARIDLLRPGIVVADHLLAAVNPADAPALADAIFRLLRANGATVISAPASLDELRHAEAVVVLDRGRVAQQGTAAEIYRHPAGEPSASASGEVNAVPVIVRGTSVESAIGSWEVPDPPFTGDGIALIRPEDFILAGPGEESDLIFAIEEAGFSNGSWHVRGYLTGGFTLRVALPGSIAVHKGKLLPLRFDPKRARLLPRPR